MSAHIDAAYDACEGIVRVHAENFAYGIRLLPNEKRRALSAIYAFARRVDDIGDGELPGEEKLRLLANAWLALPWNSSPDPADPVLVALEDVNRRFRLPVGAFDDLVAGVESDAREPVYYETFEELVGYCRQVAGSIGRLAISVLGTSDIEAATPLADDLGVALQLTNILRDVLEDRERGRVYLPREELARFDCPPDPLTAPAEKLTLLIRDMATRNRRWYAHGRALLPLLDVPSAACVEAMTRVYERILERIDDSPSEVLRWRIGLTASEKARIAADALGATEPSDWAA